MSFGIELGSLALSEYPVNYFDTFFHEAGTRQTRSYRAFTNIELLPLVEIAQRVPITRVFNLPDVSIQGRFITVSGGDVDARIHVFAQ